MHSTLYAGTTTVKYESGNKRTYVVCDRHYIHFIAIRRDCSTRTLLWGRLAGRVNSLWCSLLMCLCFEVEAFRDIEIHSLVKR